MSGSGNDFIIIDNRKAVIDDNSLNDFIRKTCRRKMSVGADGLILIENTNQADFKWRFYNSDGSRAEMCGNGARCAARFAHINKIAGTEMTFTTDVGFIKASIIDERVKIKTPDPSIPKLDYTLEIKNGSQLLSSINTGVPHVVIETDSVDHIDVFNRGQEIRFHQAFLPDGTNVNFISSKNDNGILIRTYERGVENETLACGTGAIAAALITACKTGKTSPIDVHTKSGGVLTIHFKKEGDGYSSVYLEGDARIIYKGELYQDALYF